MGGGSRGRGQEGGRRGEGVGFWEGREGGRERE